MYEDMVNALRKVADYINCYECDMWGLGECDTERKSCVLHNAAAAIEALQEELGLMKIAADGNGLMFKLLQSAQPHWVSVEERLPEVDVNVLVYAIGKIDGFIGETVIALTRMSDTNWLNHHEKVDKPYWLDPWQYFLTDYRITHWMPLPEPPQEVQDGN